MDENDQEQAVTTTRRRGVVFAHLRGEIDTDNYDVVRHQLLACLEGRPAGLVIDLTCLDFLASMGIAVLVEVRERATRVGTPFAVAAAQRVVVNPMRVSQVEHLLTLRPTLDEALAAVENPRYDQRTAEFSWWST